MHITAKWQGGLVQGKGFTLVELLVVIAIIGILASFLMPALAKAKGSARQIQCMNNLKSLGFAAIVYAQDWNNWYVPTNQGTPTTYWYDTVAYQHLLQIKNNKFPPGMYCPEAASAFSTNTIRRSYGMNYQDLMATWASVTYRGYKMDKVRGPSRKLSMADGTDGILAYSGANPSIAGGYWQYLESTDPARNTSTTAYRHGGQQVANMNFFDGHTESRVWTKVYGNGELYYGLWRAYY